MAIVWSILALLFGALALCDWPSTDDNVLREKPRREWE